MTVPPENAGNAMIYHGGPKGKAGGWGGSSGPNPDTIRIDLDEKAWHQANSAPAISALHTTPLDALYGYKTYDFDRGDGAFATFCLPHKDWAFNLGPAPASAIQYVLHFYHDGPTPGPANNAVINTSIYIWRSGESVDFAKGGGTMATFGAAIPAYQTMTVTFNNFVITDPSGSGLNAECLFFVKLRREFVGDSFPNQLRLLGGFVEFPLQ